MTFLDRSGVPVSVPILERDVPGETPQTPVLGIGWVCSWICSILARRPSGPDTLSHLANDRMWQESFQREAPTLERDPRTTVTALLESVSLGNAQENVPERLLPLVYEELRRLAGAYLGRERADHTLQATELVHEAYLKLADQSRVDWKGKTHFFAVAATAMRRILVDHARRRSREKRSGRWERVTLHDELAFFPGAGLEAEDLLVLDHALSALAEHDDRQSRIVEMRTFAGLTVEEVAATLGVSKRTVEGEWAHARAWLRRCMSEGRMT